MRFRFLLLLLFVFAPTLPLRGCATSATSAKSEARPAAASFQFDEAGVRAAVAKRMEGSLTLNASLSAESFADDAIWINAFGRRVEGRAAIEAWFVELYADAGYAQRQMFEPPQIAEIVFVRPDVAVARVFTRHGNQRLPDGTMIAERRSHNTTTLTREPDGWKVRYEIVTDERGRAARQPTSAQRGVVR